MRGLFGTPLLCTLLLSALAAPLALQAGSSSTSAAKHSPANVILFIGDGMDEHQITLARNYLLGANGTLAMEQMPVRSSAKVQTLREDDPAQYRYVADSANTASTLATGRLTSMGRIATSAGDDRDLPTVLEAARQAGLATGLVTSANLTDATPAAFATHTAHRNCQNPGDMHKPINYVPATQQCLADHQSQGGKGSIAEQLLASGVDVLLGGGKKEFTRIDSHNPLEKIVASHGYQLLQQREKLLSYHGNEPLLGLFASDHLPVEWIGEGNRRAEPMAFNLIGEPMFPTPFSCQQNPRHWGTPTLEEMTRAALEQLAGKSTGFFLMVEGASIDKQAHQRNPCGEIGELQAFDRAVAVGQAFASKHTNTLIIVTADHGQAGQIIPLPEYYQSWGGKQYPPGHYAVLETRSGELMGVSYATNAAPQGKSELHTGVNVPVFLQGIGHQQVPALIDQRTINQLMRQHLGLTSGAH